MGVNQYEANFAFAVDDTVEVVGYSASNSSRNFLGAIGRIACMFDDYGTIRFAVEFDSKKHLCHSCRADGEDKVPSGNGQWFVAADLRLVQSKPPNVDMSSLL